ncbi:MAG: DNA repair protein RadA, partial [Caldithrix sp.]
MKSFSSGIRLHLTYLKAKKEKSHFACQSCGYCSPRWLGRCPECSSWNSFIEERTLPAAARKSNISTHGAAPVQLSEVIVGDQPRRATGSKEFSRVLGGGIVAGSVVLIGGDPGIGKSTLMLQEGVHLAKEDYRVLYVSGEESARQTKLRADRLCLATEHLYILAETDVNRILESIEALSPELVVIDSIQTMHQPIFESSPGSISQVRECALVLSRMAKQRNIPMFFIGHVTKDGYIAGPKVLEHMVDVLLHFEGDRNHYYRILRAVKNRFGSTREIGVFEMKPLGLCDVSNPSAVFLEQRKENVSGSTVICTLEGTRPFLVEIQALVTPTSYGLPQRTATGIDGKRLALLLAVLEKRVGLKLGTHDVFVNAAG